MNQELDFKNNFDKTRELIGYRSRKEMTPGCYAEMGFKCGLEVHQQLLTREKLFCHCPAGVFQRNGQYDAELVRHMRPTMSELGEYDGTALMEFRTRKNIIYRIKDETACTYDMDDTPPFPINREALDIAVEIGLLLQTNIVGELHITRKQYLDGSIPTGFQRTAIIGIEGQVPVSDRIVRIIQISIEEDSCRERSDIGHLRTYVTDRLGMPLIEMVTYPDMKTPDEVAAAGQYLRFLARSTGKVRTGIGAARQDTNVSIHGGCRVEIKGVGHISWLPELTHNEAFRQKALLEIKKILNGRVTDPKSWKASSAEADAHQLSLDNPVIRVAHDKKWRLIAVNLPEFADLLSFFMQPGKMFADEISDRLKVIACIEKPNMTHSEAFAGVGLFSVLKSKDWEYLKKLLPLGKNDAQILFWAEEADVATAIETIQERCRLAFDGVPNETRKSLPDGTTLFERVLPGPDRMYPDTDSAPIPIDDDYIERIKERLPIAVDSRLRQLRDWGIPEDTYPYLLKKNIVWIIEKIIRDFNLPPRFVGTFFGHELRHLEYRLAPHNPFKYYTVYGLFKFIHGHGLDKAIAQAMLPDLVINQQMVFDSVLLDIGYIKRSRDEIQALLPPLRKRFAEIKVSKECCAEVDWLMGQLRPMALGNLPLRELRKMVDEEIGCA
jgi:glutamyl-tRNA(Gln) amidotransferase subunit E